MLPAWSSALIVLSLLGSRLVVAHPALSAFSLPPVEFPLAQHKVEETSDAPVPFTAPMPSNAELSGSPASLLADLSPTTCRSRLKKADGRQAFQFLSGRSGIANPVSFIAPLFEVEFLVPGRKTPYGALDCRQALVWLEMAPLLREHGVTKIQIDNFYRRGARIGRGKKSQHSYGLAADITAITFAALDGPTHAKTGALLAKGQGRADVEEDFLGRRNTPVCGPNARIYPRADSDSEQVARATRLRNLICEWARRGFFHHILTPNHDAAHVNHVHADIKRGNKWFMVK